MKKILILYFSGAGATKKIAELMYSILLQYCEVEIYSIENNNIPSIANYDVLIIGTPVYHGAPSIAIIDFFDTIPELNKETYAFVYNTRGLCSLNTNRILSKKLYTKNIKTIMDREYRSPASDGSILAPFIKRFFEFEKDFENKIKRDCAIFLELIKSNNVKDYIPKFRFGSIINAPNKLAGQLITLKVYLHKEKCNKCSQCIKNCPHSAFSIDTDSYPLYASKNCENCYRCIHHCPNLALSLSKKRTPKKLLKY
jgi:ferredoxin